ncbi:MAG: hypothetical protein ACM3PV_04325 [Betaproteobacteria bacterium]
MRRTVARGPGVLAMALCLGPARAGQSPDAAGPDTRLPRANFERAKAPSPAR